MAQQTGVHRGKQRARNLWTPLAVLALTALGFALRWVSIDTRGFWLDEAITVSQASQSISGIIKTLSEGVHPPLYHILVHLWMTVFGRGEVAVRSFSVLVGVIAIPAAYWAGSRMYDRATGLISAGIVTLSPYLIWYSQEARMYSLLFLAGLLSTAFLALAVRRNRASPERRGGRFWLWAGFLFWTLVGMFTHYFFTFLLIGQVAFYVFVVVAPDVRRRRAEGTARTRWWRPWGLFADVPTLGAWLTVHVVAGLALLAWLLNSVFVGSQNALLGSVTGSGLGYGQEGASLALRFNDVAAVFVEMTAGMHTQAATDVLVAMWPFTLTVMFLILHFIRPASRRTWLLVCGASGIAVMMLLGQWQGQVLASRYFAAVAAPAVLLVALLFTRIDRRTAGMLLAVLVVLWAVSYVDQSYNPDNRMRYDNREGFAKVVSGWQPGDAVFYEPFYLDPLATYYLPASTHSVGMPQYGEGGALRDSQQQIGEDLNRLVGPAQRVWLFLSFQDVPTVHDDGETMQYWFRHNGFRLAEDDVMDQVELQRYDLTGVFTTPPSSIATATAPTGRGAEPATSPGAVAP
jgi:mannosyltransferase